MNVASPVDMNVTSPVDMNVTSPVDMNVASPVDMNVTSPVDMNVTSPACVGSRCLNCYYTYTYMACTLNCMPVILHILAHAFM